jgi:hypothetical protein
MGAISTWMLSKSWTGWRELTNRCNRAGDNRWDNNGHRGDGSGDAGRRHNNGSSGRRSLNLAVADLRNGLHLGSGGSNGSEEGE